MSKEQDHLILTKMMERALKDTDCILTIKTQMNQTFNLEVNQEFFTRKKRIHSVQMTIAVEKTMMK